MLRLFVDEPLAVPTEGHGCQSPLLLAASRNRVRHCGRCTLASAHHQEKCCDTTCSSADLGTMSQSGLVEKIRKCNEIDQSSVVGARSESQERRTSGHCTLQSSGAQAAILELTHALISFVN